MNRAKSKTLKVNKINVLEEISPGTPYGLAAAGPLFLLVRQLAFVIHAGEVSPPGFRQGMALLISGLTDFAALPYCFVRFFMMACLLRGIVTLSAGFQMIPSRAVTLFHLWISD